ncbi:MAG: hypothetical protein IJF13_04775 [Clostridia bacterium]|nr:hypothetical protein [Clostridia bacterium]
MDLYSLMKKCVEADYSETDSGINYAAEKSGDSLCIFFEASRGQSDWKINLDFPARAYRSGEKRWFVHRGFAAAWKSVKAVMEDKIFDPEIKRITSVGYSHGAAISLLCHEYIYYNRPDLRDNILGYGFGCPRVIWGIIDSELKKRWENFTVIRNIDDVVTHLPPKQIGYTHVGKMLEIGERGKYSSRDAHKAENILRELKEL